MNISSQPTAINVTALKAWKGTSRFSASENPLYLTVSIIYIHFFRKLAYEPVKTKAEKRNGFFINEIEPMHNNIKEIYKDYMEGFVEILESGYPLDAGFRIIEA
jgi:hypothetical protein